ncbi:redoxin domain-containing protein [uncultured Brevundimonas sp.]|uniref:redoxin domain-containing protein n=1 Tax=uncultured Brevundimonas sp. TaxID=213418 RepID=UPI0025F85DFF|nr:redoxin domain-containing protein [uncultured Brevundimonas sp.]
MSISSLGHEGASERRHGRAGYRTHVLQALPDRCAVADAGRMFDIRSGQIPADADDCTPLYDSLVERLVRLRVGRNAPKVGTAFPAFTLPEASGALRPLRDLLDRPVVVSFVGGGGCPFCLEMLAAWKETLPDLINAGGRLLILTGDSGLAVRGDHAVSGMVDVLIDTDHGLALASGVVFHVGPELARRHRDAGLDLKHIYGSDAGLLPISAIFVLDLDGVIRHAHVDPDFRRRPDLAAVISAVKALA